jgi:hypothetical protein
MPPCGRRAVLQGVEQEAELGGGLLGRCREREHLALHLLAVDAHRAAADFPAVQHHVVGLGERPRRVGRQIVLVAVLRRGERMVQRRQRFSSSSYSNIGKSMTHSGFQPSADQLLRTAELAVADLGAQRAERVVDDLGAVGAEEDQVAVRRAGALQDQRRRRIVEVLDDRRLQPVASAGRFVDLDVRQALGAVDLDELGVIVDLGARQSGLGVGAAGMRSADDRPSFISVAGRGRP